MGTECNTLWRFVPLEAESQILMEFLALLGKLAIESDAETEHYATTTTITLGRKHKLTSCDAAYLELAMRRGVALATLDKNLRKAATMEGVPVLPVEPVTAT